MGTHISCAECGLEMRDDEFYDHTRANHPNVPISNPITDGDLVQLQVELRNAKHAVYLLSRGLAELMDMEGGEPAKNDNEAEAVWKKCWTLLEYAREFAADKQMGDSPLKPVVDAITSAMALDGIEVRTVNLNIGLLTEDKENK